jgi:hypothetical protein
MRLKFGAILLGVFLFPMVFWTCDRDDTPKPATIGATETDAEREAAFKAMSPAKHLELAGRMGLGPKAEKHLAAVPDGYPGKAELAAKIAEGRKVREAARVKAEAEAAKKREWERKNAHLLPGRELTAEDYLQAEASFWVMLDMHVKNPDSVRDIKSYKAEKSKIMGQVCWRVPITYRAANSFNAIVPGSGSIWMKDGKALRYQVD